MPLDLYPTPEILLVTPDNLAQAIERISFESKALGLDTETTGLKPQDGAEIRLIQIAVTCASDPVFIFDRWALGDEALQPVLDLLMDPQGPPVVMHNALFDLTQLLCLGCEIPAPRVRCTLMQELVLTAGRKEARVKGKPGPVVFSDLEEGDDPTFTELSCSLAACVARRLKLELPKEEQRSDWGAELTRAQLLYSATDAKAVLALHRIQWTGELRFDAGLQRTAELENQLINSLVWAGLNGLPTDPEHAEALQVELEQEHQKLEADFVAALDEGLKKAGKKRLPCDLFGEVDTAALGLRHAPTLLGWLNLLGFGLPSLDKGAIALAELDHPVMAAFSTWRKAESLVRYIKALRKTIRPNGRIYADWKQYGSSTGRMACARPNLLNLPRDGRFRRVVKAQEGWVLVGADYSQIEVRGMAVVAQDEALLDVYRQGLDVYVATAATMNGIPLAEVTKGQRQKAKAAALGLLYGLGATKFKDYAMAGFGLRMTEAEAKETRDAFFAAYPQIAAYHRRITAGLEEAKEAQKTSYEARTFYGRRRILGLDERNAALNMAVQGGCADVMKLALLRLPDALLEAGLDRVELCSAIHDEIILHARADDGPAAGRVLEEVMAAAAEHLLGDLGAGAEAVIGADWSELK